MTTYWVGNPKHLKVAIATRPRGGDWLDDDIRNLKGEGADVLVSLLEDGEANDLGLSDEQGACERSCIDFLSFPIRDYGAPVHR